MRKFLSLLICTMLAMPIAAAPVTTPDQAVDLVEGAAIPSGRDEVILQIWGPVASGTEVHATLGYVMTTPADGYVIYIDDYPTANLFHPVRYAFVDAATGEVSLVDAQSPPQNWQDYESVQTAIGDLLMSAENRRAPIPSGSPEPTRSDRWAVLANGGYGSGSNHVRYWNDLSNIYITLNASYGFADDHIIVLCSDGLDPAPDQSNGLNSDPDLDGDGDDDIMYSCLLTNVDLVFNQLASVLSPDDKLFVFWTDHGSSNGGMNTLFNLWNAEEMTDAHFASLLDNLPQCEIICTFEPCYSGGFLDNTVVPPGPRVVSSACRYDEVSWAMPPDYVYDTYVFHWTAAVKGEDAYGVIVNADYNSDGVVTMDEAFLYAETHDQSDENPQYGDYPAGVGVGISFWPTGSGPFLTISGQELDDIGGNENGAADPGETVSVVLTMTNVGSGEATNIVGTLTTTDPYLTITQNVAYFPDLGHFEQGQGSPAYMLDVSASCPQGQSVTCDLHIEADSAYTNDVVISFMVGDPMYDPVGPDSYGYYAYDILDQPEGPVYEWVEISADSGGPGTVVNFTLDDQVFQYGLPFMFQYYGTDYDSVSIATNGWIAPGVVREEDYSNSGIPNADGPPGMIAPYWEDLSPQRTNSGKVWRWYDETNHRYIVEYNHIEQYAPTGSFETFEVILLDPVYYQTVTGDGQIIIQYKEVSTSVPIEGTVGIENDTQTIGIQYLFDGSYDIHAAPLERGMAILYTTMTDMPAMNVQLTYLSGSPVPAGGGYVTFDVSIQNNETSPINFDLWIEIPPQVTLPSVPNRNLTFPGGYSLTRPGMPWPIPASWPAGNYDMIWSVGDLSTLTAWATDSFPFEKSTVSDGSGYTLWEVEGDPLDQLFKDTEFGGGSTPALPEEFALLGAYPNPFNPSTVLSYKLQAASFVTLTVYDISGRQVAELVNGWRDMGVHEVTFDGTDLASGVYIYRLEAGDFSAQGKMVLMK